MILTVYLAGTCERYQTQMLNFPNICSGIVRLPYQTQMAGTEKKYAFLTGHLKK